MPGEISSEREGAVARVSPTEEKKLWKREEDVPGWASEINMSLGGQERKEVDLQVLKQEAALDFKG